MKRTENAHVCLKRCFVSFSEVSRRTTHQVAAWPRTWFSTFSRGPGRSKFSNFSRFFACLTSYYLIISLRVAFSMEKCLKTTWTTRGDQVLNRWVFIFAELIHFLGRLTSNYSRIRSRVGFSMEKGLTLACTRGPGWGPA